MPVATQTLSPEEKDRLAKIAASRPDWQTARLGILLCLNTTMRGCEIRGLRWRDIDFAKRLLTVRHSKTEAGERAIPLNQNAWAAVQEQGELAVALFGEVRPEWFIFPRGEGCLVRPDPTQPMKGWRTAWRSMTRAIECSSCGLFQKPTEFCRNEQCRAVLSGLKSPLAGLRFHDLRHHAITELAESEASEQTILGIAGHVSPRMLRHYSHVRLEAKRKALDALSKGGSEQSDMPKDVPSHSPDPSTPPHTIDKSVTCAPIQPTINNAAASPKPEPLYEETVRINRVSMVGEKLLYTQKEAARMLSISVRMLSYMISSGQLAARRIGRRVLISGDVLVEFAKSDHTSGKRVSSLDTEIE